jgi:YVTN family beta-propeller protein
VSVDSTGTRVYVANSSSNTVSVIDAASNSVVANVPVGQSPNAFGQFIMGAASSSPPSITNGPPPGGTIGAAYSFAYTSTGSPTFSVSAGGLPPGLSLSTAGVISGTPTTVGTFSGTVTATNGTPPDATQNFSITTGSGSCTLDVDGSGTKQAFVDGIIIVRSLLGNTGTGLTAGLTIPGPNNTPALLTPVLAASNYDIDNSGTQQPFVDGIILVRLMLGVADANLLNGITLPGTSPFTTAAQIRANVNAKCGTSY